MIQMIKSEESPIIAKTPQPRMLRMHKGTILVIDDSGTSQIMARMLLASLDVTVTL